MNDRLKRRKLDALKRGVHRLNGEEAVAVSTHAIGIGRAGAGAVAAILRALEPEAPRFTALVLDIGDQDMAELRQLAATMPPDRAELTIIALDVPERSVLFRDLARYPEYLTLEYPRSYWAAEFRPWLDPAIELPAPGEHVSRAIAKAIYGAAYYERNSPLQAALRRFAAEIEAAPAQAAIAIIFGLGGGTGSGIAVDLARHLSSRLFGRRVLVCGVAVAPCDGDDAVHRGGSVFAALNELDCLQDEGKNPGIVASCGELFRNPFTAGFLLLPQQPAWIATRDLDATQRRCDQEIATLLTARSGTGLWETLRLLNWVAAPSTQHSAARTPWGPRWLHILGFADADADGGLPLSTDMPARMGLVPGYAPEFIEARIGSDEEDDARDITARLQRAFNPEVPPQAVGGGRHGCVQFLLPSVAKVELALFHAARAAYDAEPAALRLVDHSLLLEHGILLSEPSTQLEGMAGASLHDGSSWIAVPLHAVRGDAEPASQSVEDIDAPRSVHYAQ